MVEVSDRLESCWLHELGLDGWHGDPWAPVRLASVQRCQVGGYTLATWPRGHLGDVAARIELSPAYCGSWRCPRCAYGVAMQDLRRLQVAVTSRPTWLYVVLTLKPSEWQDPWQAYRCAGDLWRDRFRPLLERRFGRLEYVQTWEAHRSGWPHLNLLVRSQKLGAELAQYPHEHREIVDQRTGRTRRAHWTAWHKERTREERRGGARGGARETGELVQDRLDQWAVAAGFGERTWAELVDDQEAIACYLGKVAREIGATLWKRDQAGHGDQRPLNAPPHFRRLRASRGLLPPSRSEIRWDPINHWRVVSAGPGDTREGVLLGGSIDKWLERGVSWSDVALRVTV